MLISATTRQLLQLLADGQFHSGTELASTLNISRSSVWKHLQALSELGLEVIAVTGKGYKLPQPLQLLDKALIEAQLSPASSALLHDLEIHPVITSTNSHLLAAAAQHCGSGQACLAEYQSGGKGRRGKQWISPFGSNIYLSVLWRYQNGPAAIAGLSLAIGVAVVRVLRQLGIEEVGLKWPNDIYWRGRKLGGILIEVSGESGGPCHAVIGLGLNLYLPEQQAQAIDQAWVDMQQINPAAMPERNRLVALLLNQLLPILAEFEDCGLPMYLEEWRGFDCLVDKAVTLSFGEQRIQGVVRGVDDQGMLLLELDNGQLRSFASGEISLKLA
jgi:BirA family biotin operon repressor/biotin-[acetyl-CoA-carboxylase] ligase